MGSWRANWHTYNASTWVTDMATFNNKIPSTTGNQMKNKILMLGGILAPIVYVLTVLLGGVIRPGYSHVSQAVSDLIATNAPNKSLLDPLFALYNLLVIAFALSLFQK